MVRAEAAERIRRLIVVGDNRLKQGGDRGRVRARDAYERALTLARDAGLGDRFEPLLRRRLEDLDRLQRPDGLDSGP